MSAAPQGTVDAPPRTEPVPDALAPLRASLLARAGAEADRLRAEAEADARRRVDAARHEAGQLVAEARARAEADARWILAEEQASARRAARAVVLTAQREAWERLCRESQDAVRALLGDPGVRGGLADRLRSRLPGAEVVDLPDGGLSARTTDGRSIDASVEMLVDRALSLVEGERLWSAP